MFCLFIIQLFYFWVTFYLKQEFRMFLFFSLYADTLFDFISTQQFVRKQENVPLNMCAQRKFGSACAFPIFLQTGNYRFCLEFSDTFTSYYYRWTSMARTPMALLPWMSRTRSRVHRNFPKIRYTDNLGRFSSFILQSMLCSLIRIASMSWF